MYHIHLLCSSLKDDPFRKTQNRKSNFPPPGPAEQTRNPEIKQSVSIQQLIQYVPPQAHCFAIWGIAAMAVANALGGWDAHLRRARAKRYRAPVYLSSLIYQTQAREKQRTFSGRYLKEKKKCSNTNRLQWVFPAY